MHEITRDELKEEKHCLSPRSITETHKTIFRKSNVSTIPKRCIPADSKWSTRFSMKRELIIFLTLPAVKDLINNHTNPWEGIEVLEDILHPSYPFVYPSVLARTTTVEMLIKLYTAPSALTSSGRVDIESALVTSNMEEVWRMLHRQMGSYDHELIFKLKKVGFPFGFLIK